MHQLGVTFLRHLIPDEILWVGQLSGRNIAITKLKKITKLLVQ